MRLYAEDPAHDYRPQSGRLTRFDVPGVSPSSALPHDGIRVDAGFGAGDEVGTHYDAMIAKVVCLGADPRGGRRAGWPRRSSGPRSTGVRTNRDLLVEVLRHPASWPGTCPPTSSSGTTSRRCRRGAADAGR